MANGKVIRLQPPFWLIAEDIGPAGCRWVMMNVSTSFWFTSREAADIFCLKNGGLPVNAKPWFIQDWSVALPAMAQLAKDGLHFLLLDSKDSNERRIYLGDVVKQLSAKPPESGSAIVEIEDSIIDSIDIYCDESGKPPVKDGGEVFVVSTLAVPGGTVTDLPENGYGAVPTVKYLKALHAVHDSFMIKPGPGYGAALDKKVSIYKQISDHNGRVNRPRIWFTSGDQISHNNLVWVFAMQQIVGWTLSQAAKRRIVFLEHVRVFFNDFTHTRAMNQFFRDMIVSHVPRTSAAVCAKWADDKIISDAWRKAATRWADKFRIKSVTVQFDSEKPFLGDRGLMRLVDRLSHFTWKQVRPGEKKRRLYAAMREVGTEPVPPFDITSMVTHHDPAVLKDWEEENGVKISV